MSKSDLAQAAARHLRELVIKTGRPSEELLTRMAEEYEIESQVVRAWLLREFKSLEALDDWGATRREEIRRLPELDRARIEKLRQELEAEWQGIWAEVAELERNAKACRKKNAAD